MAASNEEKRWLRREWAESSVLVRALAMLAVLMPVVALTFRLARFENDSRFASEAMVVPKLLGDGALFSLAILAAVAVALTYFGDRRRRRASLTEAHAGHPIFVMPTWALALGGGLAGATGWFVLVRDAYLAAVGVAACALVVYALGLPLLLSWQARALARGRLTRRLPKVLRSRGTLHVLAVVMPVWLSIVVLQWEYGDGIYPYVPLLAAVPSFLSRESVWDADRSRWLRWAPHLGTAGVVPMLLLGATTGTFTDGLAIYVLVLCPMAIVGGVARAISRLRRRVVEALPATRVGIRDSIQGTGASYRDVHGLAARLVANIQRSDAGVFGLTGVRGAGKSSLARRVLHDLRPHYFTLEVTSPARHDSDLAFFVSVCRAVAQRVRDDLRPSFEPRSTVLGTLARDLRGPVLVSLAMVAAVAFAAGYVPVDRPEPERSTLENRYIGMDVVEATARQEREAASELVTSISAALSKGEAEARFVVLPSSSRNESGYYVPRFLVLPVFAEDGLRGLVESHMSGRRCRDVAVVVGDGCGDMQAPPTWMRGAPEYYSGAVARTVLHVGTRCDARMPSTFVFRCAAAEAAGASQSSGYFSAFAATPVADEAEQALEALVLDADELRAVRSLLVEYVDTLPRDELGAVPERRVSQPFSAFDSVFALVPPVYGVWGLLFASSAWSFGLISVLSVAWAPASRIARAVVNRRDLLLFHDAEAFLQELSYSASRELSRGVAWRGLSLGDKRTLADRELTLPGLTARYQWFVRRVCEHYNGKVVIAVDELDKVHDMDEVRGLLSEVKGALFVEGTYYMISISEDAARSFRRRLSSGRDIFESTFDEVIDVPPMGLEDATAMVQDRLESPTEEAAPSATVGLAVGVLLAGGVPREVLRNFRALIALSPTDSTGAHRALVVHQIDEWIRQLVDGKLSGEEVIEVRRHALEAQAAVRTGRLVVAFEALGRGLERIDPDRLRARARSRELIAPSGPEEQQSRQLEALSDEIQGALRLQISVTVGELMEAGWAFGSFADDVLACSASLHRKPALAEVELIQLRQHKLGDAANR